MRECAPRTPLWLGQIRGFSSISECPCLAWFPTTSREGRNAPAIGRKAGETRPVRTGASPCPLIGRGPRLFARCRSRPTVPPFQGGDNYLAAYPGQHSLRRVCPGLFVYRAFSPFDQRVSAFISGSKDFRLLSRRPHPQPLSHPMGEGGVGLCSSKSDFPLTTLIRPAATLTRLHPLARHLRAFAFAELLSPLPKRLKSPAPASDGR
jgi:hypothetical protein